MAEWYEKPRYTIITPKKKDGDDKSKGQTQWTKCPKCSSIIHYKDMDSNKGVCPTCAYHFRLEARARIHMLAEEGSFEEFDTTMSSADPLTFTDASGPYPQKVERARAKTGAAEGVITGRARIGEHAVSLAVMDFRFLGGSMGSAVGEKITRAIMHAYEDETPLIIVSCSGGARMHEGILSLMQMAKTSAALAKLAEKRLPYISVLTDPTTGGVTASFAMLGDVIMSEPEALIGFAGQRVIEQTIKQQLPEGFQRAEFLLEHGFVDLIVDRREMKKSIDTLLAFFAN